jgi:predicted branched-subunit amino acid permease
VSADPSPAHLPRSAAVLAGVRVAMSVPAAVLFATAIGFGAMARDGGFSFGHTLFATATMFAMPNQVMLFDQLARNETMLIVVISVALTAMRLLPMTVTLAPLLDRPRRHLGLDLALSHFVSISTWLEGHRHLPGKPEPERVPFFAGLGLTVVVTMIVATVIGYAMASNLPPLITLALLFTTPIYFFLSLLATARTRLDAYAIAAGATLIPVMNVIVPGYDLLATGLIGGTAAFLLGKARR